MKFPGLNIRSLVPRRRERYWRYVSPHRRSAGVVLLALLTVGVAAYWFVPRLLNHWTKSEATSYLHSIIGGRVRIKSARFGLFRGIEIRGVKIDAPNSPPGGHLFQADTVVLRHRPWSLITDGRLEPTEIVCPGSTITPGVDTEQGRLTFSELITQLSKSTSSEPKMSWKGPLPAVSFRDVHLHVLASDKLLNLSMVPRDGKYRIVIEEKRPGQENIRATWWLDIATGKIERVEGTVPQLVEIDTILPEQYSYWRQRYNVRGKVVLKGRPDTPEAKAYLNAELDNVSLQFPPDEGGMEMSGVSGELTFRASGVTARQLKGTIPQAGNAEFTLDGKYGGYDANSALTLDIKATNMTVPGAGNATGWLARTLNNINESFKPRGTFDLDFTISRDANGTIQYHGSATSHEMNITYDQFPYEVDQVAGTLGFVGDANGQWLLLNDVRGRHGSAKVKVSGRADLIYRNGPYDITVEASEAQMDEDLHKAIPAEQRYLWDEFRPAGQMAARFHTWKTRRGVDPNIDLTLIMDEKASMEYAGFPYRLSKLSGQVRVIDDDVTINSVKGVHEGMHCTVDGTCSGIQARDGAVNLTIEATGMPLDADLVSALPKWARPRLTELALSGQAERVSATVRRQKAQPLDFRVTAHVKDVAFNPLDANMRLMDATGLLTIRPDRLIIEELQARRAGLGVQATGQVLLDPNKVGMDLWIKAPGTRFDDALRDALPPDVRKVWTRLAPTGRGDVELSLRTMPDQTRPLEYTLTVDANSMGLRYADFPYALTDITGRAVITPDEVRLTDISARHGKARFVGDGNMSLTPAAESVNFSLRGTDVPIDDALLAAVPESLAPLAKRFKPGGTCQLDLSRVQIVREIADANAQSPSGGQDASATAPATQPASRPAPVPATAPPSAPAGPAAPTVVAAIPGQRTSVPPEPIPAVPVEPVKPAPPLPRATAQPAATTRPARAPNSRWFVQGRASLTDVTVDLGLGHKTLTGSIDGTVAQAGDDLSVDAKVKLQSVKVGRQELTDLSGRLMKKAGGHMMRLTELSARTHGGQVAGFAQMRLSDPQELGLSISVRGIRLEDMFSAMSGGKLDPDTKVKGVLTGNLQLTSIEGDNPRRQASGVLKITDGELVKVPVMLGMLNVMYLKVPGDTAFTGGELTYHMRNDDLIFDEIYLRGPALSILGSGRMNMKTETLDLKFLSGPPQKLPRLGGLSELLESIAREVAEIRVTGTLADPKMRTVPLGSLEKLLRDLTNPGKSK